MSCAGGRRAFAVWDKEASGRVRADEELTEEYTTHAYLVVDALAQL